MRCCCDAELCEWWTGYEIGPCPYAAVDYKSVSLCYSLFLDKEALQSIFSYNLLFLDKEAAATHNSLIKQPLQLILRRLGSRSNF